MLLTESVKMKPVGRIITYLRNLGYDAKSRQEIDVKIEDLQPNSNCKVDVLCDYCKEYISHTSYENYNHSRKVVEKDACKNCIDKKREDILLKKYGVSNAINIPGAKDNRIQTNIDKYGIDSHTKSEQVKEKIRNTNFKRYGYYCVSQVPEIKKKMKQTNMDKYGYENVMQSPAIIEKNKQTCLDRYGCTCSLQHPEIREKASQSFYFHGTKQTSKQQELLYYLYGGELNYPIKYYSGDIVLLDEKIDIEYNGGGHNLQVKIGQITQDEFDQREIIRNNIIKREGYKLITIISSKDHLPSDEILLQMLEQAKEYFNTTNHTWVEYNIDTSLMRNAEHKEGVFFDYGKLRRLRKEAV